MARHCPSKTVRQFASGLSASWVTKWRNSFNASNLWKTSMRSMGARADTGRTLDITGTPESSPGLVERAIVPILRGSDFDRPSVFDRGFQRAREFCVLFFN